MLYKAMSKIYLAGEYAVMRPGYLAVIAAVPKYTYLELEKSDKEEIVSNIEDRDKLIYFAKEEVFKFIGKRDDFKYTYTTELYESGKKLGLGSSASIVVVTIKALLSYYNFNFTKDDLFELSCKALISAGSRGSFGDVACICYETIISYRSLDRRTFRYEIKEINLKKHLYINAIWTGITASTSDQIKNMDEVYGDRRFDVFTYVSNKYTRKYIEALEEGNESKLSMCINELKDNLMYFQKEFNVEIYNENIDEILKSYPNSKTSGAGKGDFVISVKLGEEDEKRPTYTVSFELQNEE